MDIFTKNALNYTGGKFKLLPQIKPLFPNNINRFIDLFCGGCDVSINITANKIYCNDKMTQIINLYKIFQTQPINDIYQHIYKRIKQFNLSIINKEGYLQLRQLYNKEKNPLDLYVCICYSFNNSIRFNSKGEFNIAFGKNRSYFNNVIENRLSKFIDKIKNISFSNNDFRLLELNNLGTNDFVYCDPPYLITLANYNERSGWTENDEYDLLDILDSLSNKNIKFALSNVLEHKGKSNDILKKWSSNYNINYLNYNYSNCSYNTKDKNKNSSIEVLITNYIGGHKRYEFN